MTHLNFFSSAAAAYYTDFFLSLFGNVVIGSAFRMLNSLIWLMLSMRCCCSCYYCCRCRCCYCCCYYNFDMRPLPQLRNLFFTILLLFTFRIHLRTHGHTYIETHAHTPIVYTYTNTRAFTQISHFFLLLVPLLISNWLLSILEIPATLLQVLNLLRYFSVFRFVFIRIFTVLLAEPENSTVKISLIFLFAYSIFLRVLT